MQIDLVMQGRQRVLTFDSLRETQIYSQCVSNSFFLSNLFKKRKKKESGNEKMIQALTGNMIQAQTERKRIERARRTIPAPKIEYSKFK